MGWTDEELKALGRSPHGERGLKFPAASTSRTESRSLPSRGAWIEISDIAEQWGFVTGSLPSRGAWIEMAYASALAAVGVTSLPSRGAWIEI